MKEYKIVLLSAVFFILVCLGDAVFESLVFQEKPFWNSVILDVSGHAIFLRSMVTVSFLIFGLIVSRTFHRQKLAERALEERSVKLSESNELLEREIVERKQLEQELREKEERYKTVADFTHDWEFWASADGEFLWVSPSCERVTGYPANDFIDDPKLFLRIIYRDDREL